MLPIKNVSVSTVRKGMFVFATTVNIKKSKEKENVCMILKYSKIDRRDNLLMWYKKNNGIPQKHNK